MLIYRLGSIATVLLPAAAMASVPADQVLEEAAKLPLHVPGQYRMSVELLEIDTEVQSKPFAEVAPLGNKGEVENSEACADPTLAETSMGVQMVQEILGDGCMFEQFRVSGENVSAVVHCPANGETVGRVKMNGRIGAEAFDLVMTIEQAFPDKSTPRMRMRMRARSERVGECAA